MPIDFRERHEYLDEVRDYLLKGAEQFPEDVHVCKNIGEREFDELFAIEDVQWAVDGNRKKLENLLLNKEENFFLVSSGMMPLLPNERRTRRNKMRQSHEQAGNKLQAQRRIVGITFGVRKRMKKGEFAGAMIGDIQGFFADSMIDYAEHSDWLLARLKANHQHLQLDGFHADFPTDQLETANFFWRHGFKERVTIKGVSRFFWVSDESRKKLLIY